MRGELVMVTEEEPEEPEAAEYAGTEDKSSDPVPKELDTGA
jgi:hypothetical protein